MVIWQETGKHEFSEAKVDNLFPTETNKSTSFNNLSFLHSLEWKYRSYEGSVYRDSSASMFNEKFYRIGMKNEKLSY